MAGEAHSSNITIAPAMLEDAPLLHAMLRALAKADHRPDGVKSTVEDIARYGFGPSPAFESLIARKDARPVGFATFFYEFSTWRGCPGVYVQDLFVEEGLRGAGIGRRLLAKVIAHARANDAQYMRLAVHTANDGAMEFYRRLGFVEPNDCLFVLEGEEFTAMGQE